MNVLLDFETRLATSWPPKDWRDAVVVAAVSGGADSVAMLRGLTAIRTEGHGRLVVAHFNHRLRGGESDADEALVRELAERSKLPVEVEAAARSVASEEASRDARYDFLKSLAGRIGARFVVTAHTADDQAETVLHRIFRGSGLTGLAGIPRARPLLPGVSLLRPLLEFRRSELEAYLRELQQPFRDDASNRDLRFARNRIRHELLPLLAQDFNAQVVPALTRLATLAGEAHAAIEAQALQLAERVVHFEADGRVRIDAAAVRAEPPLLVREMLIAVWKDRGWALQAMDFETWCGLAELVQLPAESANANRVLNLPGNVRAEKKGETVVLSRPS